MKLLFLLPIMALKTCNPDLVSNDSCQVIKSALYFDGEFRFSKEELKAITRINKEKLIVIKRYYKENC